MSRSRKSLEERFWAKVEKTDECWLWRGSTIWDGYGQIMVRLPDGKPTMARVHRVAWELLVGPIPDGLWVLHHCDTSICVRPGDRHLFLGTHDDNMRDQWAKKRNYFQTAGNPSTKFTDDQIDEIRRMRADGAKLREIAAKFGISEGHASVVARGLQRA